MSPIFSRRSLLASPLALLAAPAVAAPSAPVWSLGFSPDGTLLAAGGYRTVTLWTAADWSPARKLEGHAGPVRSLAWEASGAVLAAGGGQPGHSGEVRLWNPATGAAGSVLKPHSDQVESVVLTSARLYTAGLDEKACVSPAAGGPVEKVLGDHTNRVTGVAISQDGRYLATSSLDGTVKIWDGETLLPLANLDRNAGPVHRVMFVRKDVVAAACEDGGVRIYTIRESRTGSQRGVNGPLSATVAGQRSPALALSVSVKGDRIAVTDLLPSIRLVDAGNQKILHRIVEVKTPAWAAAFSPDGALLATGHRDGLIRLWDCAGGKLVRSLGPA